jgi:hypothetical protein
MLEISLNLIVIFLLIPTIVFAVILNRRLEILRNSRNDLGRLIEAFNEATTRAEAGIPRLKQAADSTGKSLKEQIQKAQTLLDDLAFMIERAETSAGKMEKVLPVREQNPVADLMASENAAADKKDAPSGRRKRPIVESPEDLISSAISAAQDILKQNERLLTDAAPQNDDAASLPVDDGDRSEAERELLKALRAVR